MVGKTLSHYEVLAPLGAGGMGEVYRARDTKLERDVAIKVLPDDLAADPDRLNRFEREAKLLAALSHANIGSIYGLEESDGVRFLVLELIEGESLESRLQRGAMPAAEALDIARQIAEALEAAHDAGIIHRDVKPANVLLTANGGVKVLDFGIAKNTALDGAGAAAANARLTEQATSLTIDGTLMGTPPYMAPEQIRGEEADKRADIWAFGCVVYEMLTGRGAFVRETVADTLVAVLEQEPAWEALPSSVPGEVAALLRRCLRKDSRRRLRDVGDGRIEIEEALTGGSRDVEAVGSVPATPSRGISLRLAGIAAIAALVLGSLITATWLPPTGNAPSPEPPTYLDVALPDVMTLWGGSRGSAGPRTGFMRHTAVDISRDGAVLVYAATDGETAQIYRRDLGNRRHLPVVGTEGGSNPFLSPDGRNVGFVVGRDILTVPIDGGEPTVFVADAPFYEGQPYGPSWGDDGSIVFPGTDGIYRVSAPGGDSERLTEIDPLTEVHHRMPRLLPGGAGLMYTSLKFEFDWESANIFVVPPEGEPRLLVADGADARYVPTGHVVFARRGTLVSCAFDLERLEPPRDCLTLEEDVMQAVGADATERDSGIAQFSVSDGGTLAFAEGGVHPQPQGILRWVRPGGTEEPWDDAPSPVATQVRISPDGQRVAVSAGWDLYVVSLVDGATRHFPLEGSQWLPVWSPDGEDLMFSSNHHGGFENLYLIDADLVGPPRRLTESATHHLMGDWSAKGVVAFVQDDEDDDIWIMGSLDASEPVLFAGGPSSRESWPTFSPDGEWLAYSSDKDGRHEVYARRVSDPSAAEYQISRLGGREPAFSQDGEQLFFRPADSPSKMMAVIFDGDAERPFSEEVREILDLRHNVSFPNRPWDVAKDGRFIFVFQTGSLAHSPVHQLRMALNRLSLWPSDSAPER